MWDKPYLMLRLANLLYALAAILLFYMLLLLLVRLPLFPLREVTVNGQLKHLTPQQVEYAVERTLKGNFFTLNLNQVRSAFEKLPWVRSAAVRRRWPDRLEVTLKEHVALARWGNKGLVGTTGQLFQAASNKALPVFIGQVGDERDIVRRYWTFKKELRPLKLVPAQILLSPRRAWKLRLNNGLVIELGRKQVDVRLAKFVAVYGKIIERFAGTVRYVDLRYPNGFAVRRPRFKGKAVVGGAA